MALGRVELELHLIFGHWFLHWEVVGKEKHIAWSCGVGKLMDLACCGLGEGMQSKAVVEIEILSQLFML